MRALAKQASGFCTALVGLSSRFGRYASTMLAGAGLAAIIAVPGHAADTKVDPERRDLLVGIIESLGCKVDGVAPPQEFLDAMAENNFVKDETKAIAAELLADGIAERNGPTLTLKTEACQ